MSVTYSTELTTNAPLKEKKKEKLKLKWDKLSRHVKTPKSVFVIT